MGGGEGGTHTRTNPHQLDRVASRLAHPLPDLRVSFQKPLGTGTRQQLMGGACYYARARHRLASRPATRVSVIIFLAWRRPLVPPWTAAGTVWSRSP